MFDVLQLCEQLTDHSVEQLSMRIVGEILLHLLCAQGLRQTDMLDSIKKFRSGKWEKLWGKVIKTSNKLKCKRAANPAQPRARTDSQKDSYAQKCAKAGNYSKANQVICQEMLHACDDDTLEKLRRLHPVGDLNFDREFWPGHEETRAYWSSEEGEEKLDKFLSVEKIREYFRQRPALGSPDIDGWQGREHVAFMLMDGDEEFQELFRSHLILPHVLNRFQPEYSQERAGGHLFAFIKANGGLRPILCGSLFRRCFAALMSKAWNKDAGRHFADSVPNFMQCAGGMRDGTTRCAQLLRTFDSEPSRSADGVLQAILEIDLVNAFNSASRQAAFDVIAGTASRDYDQGRVNRGDSLPTFSGLRHMFGYFSAMHDTEGTLRYVGPDGEVHHVNGTSGGQQGDPLEMMRFCATIHPIWARVMARYDRARALAFADDGFVRSSLLDCLHILAELKIAFKEDAGLDICLPKCKIYIKSLTLAEAREEVQGLMEADEALHSLKDILTVHDDPSQDVVQVEGMICVGVPVGSPAFVQAFVKEKTKKMVEDIKQLQLLTDPGVHLKLIRFCHNTRLAHLGRNLPPTTMANQACGVQTVDYAVANEVLAKGTGNRSASWTPAVANWHRMRVQLPHFKGGLGLTPQRASSLAAFYSASSTFVGWLAQRTHMRHWIRQDQRLDAHSTWTADPLVELKAAHRCLIQTYKCVEAAPDAAPAAAGADNTEARAAAPLSLPPLNLLHKQHSLSEKEIGAGCVLPPQRRVTKQVMRNWEPHVTAKDAPPNDRCRQMLELHCKQSFPAISRVAKGEPGHSILGPDMPIEEEPDCDPSKQARVEYSPLAHAVCLSDLPWKPHEYESYFCQLLGVPLPQLVPLAREGRVCACGRHVIDEFGDHIHSCKKHTGSTKAAHETLLDALEALCFQAGIKTERRNIPSVTKPNRKIGRGDLVLLNVNIGGHRHLIIDVALNHEFGGNHMADVTRNGAMRAADPARLLEATARTKIARYREGYANRNGVTYAFLPCVMSTSGRMHGEFLRLLFIIAHRRTVRWFTDVGDDHHSADAFKFRRGQYFWHTRAAIGHGAAVAVAQRAWVAGHTLRRPRVPPNARDALLFPATVPSGF